MWADRRKRHTVVFKVDDYELQIIEDIMKANEVSKGEAIRRALWVFRILYADDLTVRDALAEPFDPDGPLHAALKPIPELSHHLGLEFKLWRKQSGRTAT
jgi:hypothetical protein